MDWGQSWGREISILDVSGEHIYEAMTRQSMNIGKNQWQSVFKKCIYIASKEIRKILQSCEIPSWFSHASFLLICALCSLHTLEKTKRTKKKKILLNGFYVGLIHRQHFQKFSFWLLNLGIGNSHSGLHKSYSEGNSTRSVVSSGH